MTNLDAGALLVELYAKFREKNLPNKDYAEAVAMAVSALGKGDIQDADT